MILVTQKTVSIVKFMATSLFVALLIALFSLGFNYISAYAAINDTESTDNMIVSKSSNSAKATNNVKKAEGLIEKKDGLFFFENGKKVTSSWRKIDKKRYYFGKDGKALKGVRKIAGNMYMINKTGILYHASKDALVQRDGETYLVTNLGRVLTGWQLYRGKLYHFANDGKMDKSTIVDRVRLDKNGVARSSKTATTKIQALKIIDKISPKTASKSARLHAAWKFMISHRNFSYMCIYPNQSVKNWQYDTASYMLKNRRGNCYSFACAFAALAQAIGYEPVLALGRIHGSRDRAADGFTRHSWVKIDGRYYDPELKFAGSASVYGTSGYPLSAKNVRYRKF